MSEVEKYINERKKRDLEFADNFEEGYSEFKIGILLRQAREAAALSLRILFDAPRTLNEPVF